MKFSAALVSLLAVCSFVSLSEAQPPSSSAPDSDGWALLWTNEIERARDCFTARLADDKHDLEARRGLVLALLARGRERAAIDALFPIAKESEAGAIDLLLGEWVYMLTRTHGKDEKAFLDFLERVASKREMDVLDRRVILSHAAPFALNDGDKGEVESISESLHRIDSWSLLGPFENVSGSGHAKDHLQRGGAALDREYTGKGGLGFRWINVGGLDLLNRLNAQNHVYPAFSSSIYMAKVFRAWAPGTYLLSLSRDGALSVWIDDVQIVDLPEPADQEEMIHFEVDIPDGMHSLLLKVSGNPGAPTASAAFSKLDGKTADQITYAPILPAGLQSGEITVRPRPVPMVEALRTAQEADTLDAAAAFWRLVGMARFGLQEEAKDVAPRLAGRFPGSAIIQHAAARALGGDRHREQRRRLMEAAAVADPSHADVILWEADEKIRKNLVTSADSILTAAIAREPEFIRARLRLLDLYADQDMSEELQKAANEFIGSYPDYPKPWFLLADEYEDLRPKEARKMQREGVKRSLRSVAIVSRLIRAEEKENLKELEKRLKELAELFPDSPKLATQLVSTRLQRGVPESWDECSALVRRFPNSPDAQYLRARLTEQSISYSSRQKEMKNTAIGHYQRVLELMPGFFEAREKLRHLKGLKPVAEILPPIDLEQARADVSKLEAQSGDEAVVLLDERRRIVFEDGSSSSERAVVVKLFTEGGVERFGSLGLGVNSLYDDVRILEARSVKPDGTTHEALRGGQEVAFQALAPGDLVELHYQWTSRWIGALGNDFWDTHYFQWNVPCHRSVYRLLVASSAWVDWSLHNRPEETDALQTDPRGDFVLRSWTLEDVPAFPDDPLSGALRDNSPWLDVSSVPNWLEIVSWYSDLSEEPSRPDPEIRRMVRSLISSPRDTTENIRSLFRFVADDVAYENLNFQYSAYIPEAASSVLRSRFGDCKDQACLLRAMLGELGVKSYFALVSPVDIGRTPFLPSPRFSHAILAVPDPVEGYVFLDPTYKGLPYGVVPASLQGSPALIVRPGTMELYPIPREPQVQPEVVTAAKISLEPSGDMVVEREESVLNGEHAAEYRRRFGTGEPEERERALLSMLGRTQIGLEVVDAEWPEPQSRVPSARLAYRLRIRGAVSSTGSLRLVQIPWRFPIGETVSQLVSSPARRIALCLDALRTNDEETAVIQPPSGWRLEEPLPPVFLECPNGTFELSARPMDEGLEVTRSLRIKGDYVFVDDYPAFRTFLEDLKRAQDAVLVFRARE